MSKKWFILLVPIITGLISFREGWKNVDLTAFKISIPYEWHYKKAQGKDSFVGYIVGPKSSLTFDFSYDGYAGTILPPGNILEIQKTYHIQIDSTEKYSIKIIWPKVPSKGVTGIYFKGINSHLTFNMVGMNLSKKDQDLALKAFKTISIK